MVDDLKSSYNSRLMKNSWITQSEKIILDSPFMKILERNSTSSETGKAHRFFLFRSRNWANIIPVTSEGKVVLIRQYRVGVDRHTLEVPGGVQDEADQDPTQSALRELAEETGYTPLPGARCISLGGSLPNPAIQDNTCFNFIVGPVQKTQTQNLDPGEMIETLEVAVPELCAMIARGEIDHALMLMGFFKLLMRAPESATLLGRELEAFRTV